MPVPVHRTGPVSGAVSVHQADVDRLDAAARQYRIASKSKATLKAYLSDFHDFTVFCSDFDLQSMPASPETVGRYLADLPARGLVVSTVNRRAAAIAYVHRAKGHDSPNGSESVRAVLTGIRNTHGARPTKKKALTADLVAKVVKKIPAKGSRHIRDRALILLAFGAALRRSELVALEVDQVERHRKGLLVRLGRTKTDQAGQGASVGVPDGKLKIGDAVFAWIEAAGIVAGPIFRGFDQAGAMMPEHLSAGHFARVLKARCKAAGLDPDLFSGHSPRRGFATDAGDAGADLRHTARHMRHAKLETTLGYMEDGDLFRESAGKGFL